MQLRSGVAVESVLMPRMKVTRIRKNYSAFNEENRTIIERSGVGSSGRGLENNSKVPSSNPSGSPAFSSSYFFSILVSTNIDQLFTLAVTWNARSTSCTLIEICSSGLK